MSDEILKLSKFKLSVFDKVLIDNTNDKSDDFIVNSGDLVLLCGANGSGKTTLMKKIIGTSDTKIRRKFNISFKKNREIKYDGVSMNEGKPFFDGNPIMNGILDEIGFAPNDSDLKLVVDESIKVIDYINAYLNGVIDKKEIDRLFSRFYGHDAKKIMKKKISKCSSGEQKKLSIIAALLRKEKKLYIFDEPMNCLDTRSMIIFMEEIKKIMEEQQSSGVVIITHCLTFDNPSKVYKIVNCELVDDTVNYKKRDCLDYLLK